MPSSQPAQKMQAETRSVPIATPLPSAAREARRALLQEGPRALLHVGGGGAEAEEGRLEDGALGERHLETAADGLEYVATRDRAVGVDRLRHLLRRGQRLARGHDLVDEPDPMGLRRVDLLGRQ